MRKILLVDDSTTTQKLISITLASEPYEIMSALDSKTALDLINKSTPDIVLVDTHMNGMNGFELCREIKSRPSTSKIRVVLLFGVFDEVDQDQVDSVGADATLVKPFETKSLLEVLSSILMVDAKRLAPEKLKSLPKQEPSPKMPDLPKQPHTKFDIDDLWMEDQNKESFGDWTASNPSQKSPLSSSSMQPKTSLDSFQSNDMEALLNHPRFKQLIEELAIQKMEEILWEVIPDAATAVIKEEIQKLLNS